MNVLSLFDGISCGQVAFERLGIKFDGVENKYYASEIDKYAIQITQKNYPNTIQIGDVTKIDFSKFIGEIDILIGGSPCQDLCSCGSGDGLNGQRSSLFYKWVEARDIINPEYWLLENNFSMSPANKNLISDIIGCSPIFINSNLVSAQDRKRLYWTNIQVLSMPEDKHLLLKDIVEDVSLKSNIYDKMCAKKLGTTAYKRSWGQVRNLNQKALAMGCNQVLSRCGTTCLKYSDTEYYIFTPIEAERLQTLPDNYTEGLSKTQRYKGIGNGWTVDVIAHILSFM